MFPFLNYLFIALSGASIGFLSGLSTSPLAQSIITALLALISTLFSIFGTMNDTFFESKIGKVNIFATGFFLIGVAIGAPTGIYCRANDIFGFNPSVYNKKWSKFSKDSLFNQRLKNSIDNTDSFSKLSNGSGILYNENSSFCSLLKSTSGNSISSALKLLNNDEINIFLESNPDSIQLEIFKKQYIKKLCQE